MFKRNEKKIKAVFKLQFQATQVPQLKAKSLMISLVPVGVGKPTLRLPKEPIVDGSCIWQNPVYQTVKLVMDTKTRRIREKFYYLIVSTGSSKSGFIGEVSIDFADLAEATKPLNLTLPLQTSKSGAILHITVQKMEAGSDSRHDEDSEDQSLDTEQNDEMASVQDEQNGNLEIDQMKMVERKAELAELEVESLRKQIIKETRRGQQLSDQIIALEAECEQLKCENDEKIKQELQHERQMNKKLKLQIQTTEDANSEYVLTIRDLTKKLEQKNIEISQVSSRLKAPGMSDEVRLLEQKIENLHSEMEVHKKEKAEMQMELERLTQDCESLDTENEQMCSKLEQMEKEKTETQRKYAESLATMKQFKFRITSLEAENKRQALQYSELINDLEVQVQSLQKELENQARVFEEDLEAVTEAKVEQEQRAIRAEEALRKSRWSNENEPERLKMKENEKLERKAIAEADDLRKKNKVLEEQLKRAKEEQQMQASLEESNLANGWKLEKEKLERDVATMRQEADKLKRENVSMKESMVAKNKNGAVGEGRNKDMEEELKEMRERYSEISLKFAEVEGERQQLVMALRNMKTGKKN